MFVDYYAILEVEPSVSQQELKSAFRTLAKKWHPDKNFGVDTTKQMQLINEAWILLRDEEARRRYDIEYKTFRFHQQQSQANPEDKQEKEAETEKESTSSSSTQSDAPKYEYQYTPQDEILKKWMASARKQSIEFCNVLFGEVKDTGKKMTFGLVEGILSLVVLIIVVNIIFFFVNKVNPIEVPQGDDIEVEAASSEGESLGIPDNSVKGDFNGDGTEEYMWLEKPLTSGRECTGECNCTIRFSDKNISSIIVDECIGGNPINEGDLNNDGRDEIGILPDWWQSCWKSYKVYTLKSSEWELIVPPISTHCVQWDDGVDAIEIRNEGLVIRSSTMEDGDFVVKEEFVKISELDNTSTSNDSRFPKHINGLEDFSLNGLRVVEQIRSDFNKDGYEDLIAVTQETDPSKISENVFSDFNDRAIYIYITNGSSELSLQSYNDKFILNNYDRGPYGLIESIEINNKGDLEIRYQPFVRHCFTYIFRYKKEYELIGFNDFTFDISSVNQNFRDESINFLTGETNIEIGSMLEGGESRDNYESFNPEYNRYTLENMQKPFSNSINNIDF